MGEGIRKFRQGDLGAISKNALPKKACTANFLHKESLIKNEKGST